MQFLTFVTHPGLTVYSKSIPYLASSIVSFSAFVGCSQETTSPSQSARVEGAANAATADGVFELTLADFEIFPNGDTTWSGDAAFETTGENKGYIYTGRSFGEGTISFEYRFPADLGDGVIPNTGLLLLIEPPHKKWPRCIEAQGKQSEAGQLKGNGGVDGLNVTVNEETLATAINPPGEWNAVEVVVSADTVSAVWNGQITAECDRAGLPEGAFGLQSEGNPVAFRNVRFTPR